MNDFPWFKFYEEKLPRTLKPYPEITLLDVVSETVRLRPDHTALIFKGARMSYAELDRLSDNLAAALTELGFKVTQIGPGPGIQKELQQELYSRL